jgi:hypothetical protein
MWVRWAKERTAHVLIKRTGRRLQQMGWGRALTLALTHAAAARYKQCAVAFVRAELVNGATAELQTRSICAGWVAVARAVPARNASRGYAKPAHRMRSSRLPPPTAR